MLHKPVLLQEALKFLGVMPGARYIDATLGSAGHAAAIIQAGGKLLGIDIDRRSLNSCPDFEGLIKICGNFAHISDLASSHSWLPVAGIIADLGLSSQQLDNPDYGLSFQVSGPLDMRLDRQLAVTAADLINSLDQKSLTRLFKKYGQEPFSATIARRIVKNRPLTTTTHLASLINNPDICRRIFQALRIAVNAEQDNLSAFLSQVPSLLAPGGRAVIISFHSLEDRLVKAAIKSWVDQKIGKILTPKPVLPSLLEIQANPRAHSAKLRAFVKY